MPAIVPAATVEPGTPEVIDLFAGPGGLDVAAHWLGLTTTGVEFDDNACATRASAGLMTKQSDVRDLVPGHFPGASILAGGPPCQTYTVAGTGSGRRSINLVMELVRKMARDADIEKTLATLEDERTGLVLQPLRWALAAYESKNPYESIVLEQVPAVLPIWNAIGDVLDKLGYGVETKILKSEQFGVPQTRRRAFLIARWQTNVVFPEPTHAAYRKGVKPAVEPMRARWVAMEDALDRKTAFTVVSNYGSGGDPKNRGQRTSNEPAATITGKVTRNRITGHGQTLSRFTPSEAGILQTFPADYPWSGKDVGQQIGNAVPPRLAAHVLAAAIGRRLSSSRLDEVVKMKWTDSRNGIADLVLDDRYRSKTQDF